MPLHNMEDLQMTRDQVAVLAFVLAHVDTKEEVEILSFRLADECGDLFHAAVLGLGADDDGREISLLVTLPAHSQGVFMALAVGHKMEVARMLAGLEDYERETWHALRPLESVVTDHPSGIRGLFLLPPATHAAISGIPDSAMINARERHFLLVLPITAEEYACKMQGGVDALLVRLQESDK